MFAKITSFINGLAQANPTKKAGKVLIDEKTGEAHFDASDIKRVKIRDIVILETELQRLAVAISISSSDVEDGFYYVVSDNALWFFHRDTLTWTRVNKSGYGS